MKLASILGAVMIAAVSTAARADEGRIPIYRATTVAEAGSYFLSRDVASSVDAVQIAVSGVTLDLGGHVIDMTGPGTAVVVSAAVSNVTIRNGTLRGGTHGIVFASGGSRARVTIENVRILGPSGYGVYVSGAETLDLRKTEVVSAGLDGVYADGLSGCFTAKLVDNVIENPGRGGIYLRGLQGGEVRGNSVTGASASGIEVTTDPAWTCGSNVVDGNTVRGLGGSSVGIEVGATLQGTIVKGNVVSGNGQEGIRVDGSGTLVESNLATGNLYGLRIPCTNNRYRNNMLLGNTTTYCTGSCCGTGNAGGNLY